jgi:hypothetical protein
MTNDRWTNGDTELTKALRVLYAGPVEESYRNALEARILDYVARVDERSVWWNELAEMIRPGLIAAAALILAASLAMARSEQLEARNAYATLIAPSPASVEPSTRAASVGDGDMAIHLLLSR